MPTELGHTDGTLAEACSDMVRRRRRQVSGDAEDAMQDACVRVLQLDKPQTVREPVHYLLRTTRNLLIDYRRRRNSSGRIFADADTSAAADDRPGPERILAGKEALAGILRAIELLPPRCREAFVLHRFEELSYSAIAHRMGISISMVEKHIAEAMSRLARALAAQDQP